MGSKDKNAKKTAAKKPAQKSLKEKRAAKQAKKVRFCGRKVLKFIDNEVFKGALRLQEQFLMSAEQDQRIQNLIIEGVQALLAHQSPVVEIDCIGVGNVLVPFGQTF